MKIGFFTDTYFPQVDGVVFTVDTWSRELRRRGHEVVIYYPKSSHRAESYEVPFPSFPFLPYRGYRIALPSLRKKSYAGLEVLHSHALFTMALASVYAARKLKLPLVLSYHTPVEKYVHYITSSKLAQRILQKLCLRWVRSVLSKSELVIAPSHVVKQMLTELTDTRVEVLSNGVDLRTFRPIDKRLARERFGLPADERVVGFCGRIGYEKRLEDLINATPKLNGTVVIAGDGPALSYYRKLAKGKGVRFLPFIPRDDLAYFYSALDVFVSPSVVETQGLVALEAMACGTPVVGANALALKETIVEGLVGFLYEPGCCDELVEAVERTLAERKRLSENCTKYVKENHSLERSIEKLLSIYEQLI